MRIFLFGFTILLAGILANSCRTASPLPREKAIVSPPEANISHSLITEASPTKPLTEIQKNYATQNPQLSRNVLSGIEFEGVEFDSSTHHLKVIDQENGPGTEFLGSAEVANSYKALLAINAGFFTPEGKPLGWVISNGEKRGDWNASSSLGSGIFSENSSGQLMITRRTSASAYSQSNELIQAGPLLIEESKAISGLDSQKKAQRSIIFTDGNHRWWIGKTSLCSLASLGSALTKNSPAPWKIRHALNLDGGRSTDLYISQKIPGGPINRRSVFNRPVRNFLILTTRN